MSERLEWKNLPLRDVKASADGGEFEGLAAAFCNVDASYWPDILAPGCFAQDLPEFLAEGFVSGINHDWCQPIGRPVAAVETREGLQVKATVSDTTHGRDVRTLLKDGVVKRLSIGFRVLQREWLDSYEQVVTWWAKVGYQPTPEDHARAADGVRLVTRVKLYEFGPVAVPANSRAVITGVKSEGGTRLFEEHSAAVLEAAAEWVERVRDLSELRAGKGRAIGEERLAEVRRLRVLLEGLERDARPVSAAGKSGGDGSGSGAGTTPEALLAQFEALTARQHGLPV